MPQPLSHIAPDARFQLRTDALGDKPELSGLVTRIIAFGAVIEQEQETLFHRMTDASEQSAVAVFSILQSEGLQRTALDALAKAKFGEGSEDFLMFTAVLNIAKQAMKARHKLAHWRWGVSAAVPDALLLADPRSTKAMLVSHQKIRELRKFTGSEAPSGTAQILKALSIDPSTVLVYYQSDLEAALSELGQAAEAMLFFGHYLTPVIDDEEVERLKAKAGPEFASAIDVGTRAEALRRLSSLSLYQEARARLSQGTNKSPQPPA